MISRTRLTGSAAADAHEEPMPEFDVASLRIRRARDLHDGVAQVLAALDLELATCRELVLRGGMSALQAKLAKIAAAIRGEQERIRAHARALAGEPPRPARRRTNAAPTRVSLSVECEAPPALIGEVLAITREALTNVERHAEATSATIRVRSVEGEIRRSVEDDGIGMSDERPAWTIASRVRDLAGRSAIAAAGSTGGTRLAVVRPEKATQPRH